MSNGLTCNSTSSLPRDHLISKDFFSAHILREEEGGYFSGSDGLLSVESRGQGCPSLTLLEGPGYRPSYVRGLHTATVQQVNTAKLNPSETGWTRPESLARQIFGHQLGGQGLRGKANLKLFST